jgi:hypothetical protein
VVAFHPHHSSVRRCPAGQSKTFLSPIYPVVPDNVTRCSSRNPHC